MYFISLSFLQGCGCVVVWFEDTIFKSISSLLVNINFLCVSSGVDTLHKCNYLMLIKSIRDHAVQCVLRLHNGLKIQAVILYYTTVF